MRFIWESTIAAPVEDVFAFHERPGAFERLQPPWERVDVIQPPLGLDVGTVVVVRAWLGPVPVTIEAEHVAYERNRRFEDVMRRGPFSHWHHRHIFEPLGASCRLRDEIDYALPLGPLGVMAARIAVQRRLTRLFAYRHMMTARAVVEDSPARA